MGVNLRERAIFFEVPSAPRAFTEKYSREQRSCNAPVRSAAPISARLRMWSRNTSPRRNSHFPATRRIRRDKKKTVSHRSRLHRGRNARSRLEDLIFEKSKLSMENFGYRITRRPESPSDGIGFIAILGVAFGVERESFVRLTR